MDYKRFENIIIAKFDRSEEFHEKLKEIAKKENIKLASVNAIGATDNFTIGAFKVSNRDYKEITFKGDYEILSIIGSISTKDGEYYPHLHITCADENWNAFGGHLKEANISVTSEITINILEGVVEREVDEFTVINIYKFN